MTFTTFANLQSAVSLGNKTWKERFYKTSINSRGAGSVMDLWTTTGYPTAGATPNAVAGAACSVSTTGAFPIARNPSGEDKRYLLTFGSAASSNGVLLLIDRLVHTSNLSGTVTTAQTVNSAALTRYTTGDGVLMAAVCWTPTGSTASNITVSYTNQAGTASRTSPSMALWTGGWGHATLPPVAGQIQFIPLQAGDTGVRSIQSATLSASTTTAGSWGFVLFKPLAAIHLNSGHHQETDYIIQTSSLPQIEDNACLSFMNHVGGGATSAIPGSIETVEG